MKALRIIVVLPEPPLPFAGTSARWFYVLVKGLTDRGHRVSVFCATFRPQDEEQVRQILPGPQYDIRCFPTDQDRGLLGKINSIRRPYSYVFSAALEKSLQAELALGYDVLHLEQLWTGWIGLPFRDRASVNVHYTLERDLAAEKPASAKEWLLRKRLRDSEHYLLRQYQSICCLSDPLRDYIRSVNPTADVTTVTLGLDTSLYGYQESSYQPEAPTVGLIGSYNWVPSLQAGRRLLDTIFPALQRQIPGAQLLIVGRKARSAFSAYLDRPNITIEENVPDTIPYFRKLDLMIYATEDGSGTKVKVQEAFALGTPVATTAAGIEGMPAKDGVHVTLGQSDQQIVDRAVELLRNPAQMQSQRRAARTLIEESCGPAATVSKLEQAFAHFANGGRP